MSDKFVLAFEPDPLYAQLLQDELGARGYTVEIVSDGAEGLQRATTSNPDLIYLCIELPRISGFSVCNKLRKNPDTSSIPLLVVSAEANQETFDKHKKLKTAADYYILKPFDADKLNEAVNELLDDDNEELLIDDDDAELIIDDDIDEFEEIEELLEVDDEMDSFVEDGFDSIATESSAPKQPAVELDSEPEFVPVAESVVDNAELEKLKKDNALLHDQVSKLEKNVAEAQASKGGGVSSREFLDLRELLNKKDRELLDLKDSVNSKEKQFLESRERLIDLERTNADLEDTNITAEKQINDLTEKVANLDSDKEVINKKSLDLQNRIDTQHTKIEGLEAGFEADKATYAAEVEKLKVAEASTLERVVAEKNEEKEAALNLATSELKEDKNKALIDQETELKEDAAKAIETALTEQRLRYEADAEELHDQMNSEKQEVLAEKEVEHAANVAALNEDFASKLGEYKSKLYDNEKKTEALNLKLEEASVALGESREELSVTQATFDESTNELQVAKERVEAQEEQIESLNGKLGSAVSSIDDTNVRLEKAEKDLSEKSVRVAELEGEVEDANEVLEQTDAIVDKTRQALMIASGLLDGLADDEAKEE